MITYKSSYSVVSLSLPSSNLYISHFPNKIPFTAAKTTTSKIRKILSKSTDSDSLGIDLEDSKKKKERVATELQLQPSPCSSSKRRFCLCGRRGFLGTTLLPTVYPSLALDSKPPSDPMEMLKMIHPPRPDWYEEFYASTINSTMGPYEAEVAVYKSKIFENLRGKANKILELGIGTGPNLKYYAGNHDVNVIGVDPNQKMEKYAKAAALSNGVPPENFEFMQAVGEALPIGDASVDAVVGTLVLCSVKDVNATLQEVRRVLRPGGLYLFVEHVAAKDGTILRFAQGLFDPLQQTVADGCHLSRNTGTSISAAGFSSVDINMVSLPTFSLVSPHVYGIACK